MLISTLKSSREKGGTLSYRTRKSIDLNLALLGDEASQGSNIKEGTIEPGVPGRLYLLPLSSRLFEINHFSEHGVTYEKVASPVKGVDFAIVLSGDGLGPEFPDGTPYQQ